MKIVLVGPLLSTLDEVHAVIAATPGVPDHYGRNLDALNDVLTEGPFHVLIEDLDALRGNLGPDADRLLQVLLDAVAATPHARLAVSGPTPPRRDPDELA